MNTNTTNRVKSSLSPFIAFIVFIFLFFSTILNAAWEPIFGGRGNFTTDSNFHLLYGGVGTSIRGDFTATGNSILRSNHPNNANLINDTTTLKTDDISFNSNTYSLNDTEKMNSSSANIVLPSYVKGSDIIWAGLFWQGHVYRRNGTYNDTQVDADASGWNKVTIKDSNGTMHQIEAPIGNDNLTHKAFHHTIRGIGTNKGYRHHYGAYHDVTDIVKNSYSYAQNTFTVGNIKTTPGRDQGGYVYIPQAPAYSGSFRFGLYGGWSMIVVYDVDSIVSDANDVPLKTVSIYDGFDLFLTWGNGTVPFETTIDISGFYTPKSGDVNSKLLLFGGAGDRGIKDDTLQIQNKKTVGSYVDLSNTKNDVGEQFNHTYTIFGQHMTPTDANKQGMDLDIYDISNQIDNEQTSTKIKFGVVKSGGHCDQLFPQVIGFSTELYEPRVCYFLDTIKDDDNNTIFEDKKFIAELTGNKNYKFNMWISNMKANSGDTFLETADLVSIYMNTTDVNYTTNSTYMQNINEAVKSTVTDIPNDDRGEYDDNKSTWRVGVGSNSTVGGTIEPANSFTDDSKKVYISFESKLNLENNATNIDLLDFFEFRASLKTASTTIDPTNAQVISQCRDLNTYGAVAQPPIGAFNVTNEYANMSTGDPLDGKDFKNALFTQISDKSFNIKIVSLESDNIALRNFTGNIILDLIDGGSVTEEQSTCTNAPLLQKYTNPNAKTNMFNNESTKNFSLQYPGAVEDARFRVKFYDLSLLANFDASCNVSNPSANINGVPQCLDSDPKMQIYFKECSSLFTNVCNSNNQGGDDDWACYECITGYNDPICSRDNFSIRPETYSMDMNDTQLVGGRTYQLDVNATQNAVNTNASGYTQTIDNGVDKNATDVLDVPTGCALASNVTLFTNNIIFNNGSSQTYSYTYPNVGDINITIIDAEWTQVDQSAYNGKAFSDCIEGSSSNTPDANGKIGCLVSGMQQFVFTPKEFQNTLDIENFNDGLFTYISNDVNMSAKLVFQATAVLDDDSPATNYTAGCFSKDINSTFTLISNPANWLNGNPDAINRIVYFDDSNTTNLLSSIAGVGILASSEGNFTNGITNNIEARFNISRSIADPDEPFNITRDDFNISIVDENSVTGSGYSATADTNTTFYYGRSHGPDQRFIGPTGVGVASILYEVYCDGCDRTAIGMNTYEESSDSINWYENNDHNTTNHGVFNKVPLITSDGTTITATTLNSASLQTPLIGGVPKLPHKDKVQLQSDPWLVHTPTDFLVEFYQAGTDWAGEGQLGAIVDTNVSTRQNRRIDW